MSHFGRDKWPTLDYRYECMFLILVCGTIVFQEQEEIRNRQRLVAGEVWSSRRDEEGGRCKSKGILSQSFKAESFFQHIIQIAQKKHMFWHTCAEMIHVEVNTLNSHISIPLESGILILSCLVAGIGILLLLNRDESENTVCTGRTAFSLSC